MLILILCGLLLLVALVAAGLLWQNQRAVVDLQLGTHKMMFPTQIKAARRAYMRGLYRQEKKYRYMRGGAIACGILALPGLWVAWSVQQGQADTMTPWAWTFIGPTVEMLRNLPLTLSAGFVLLACALALRVAAWQQQTLLTADQGHDANDLYFTPVPALLRQLQLRRVLAGALSAAFVLLALASWAGWLPAPDSAPNALNQVQPAPTPSSSESGESTTDDSSSDSESSSSAATPSSDSEPDSRYTTQTAVVPFATAKLAPASSLQGLTQADRASFYLMVYWSLQGLTPNQIAAKAADTSYHVVHDEDKTLVKGELIVFTSNDATPVNQFFACFLGENVALYDMGNSTQALTSLATQYNIRTVNGTPAPQSGEIAKSAVNIRRLVTAFEYNGALMSIQSGLQHGGDVPY